MATKKKKKEPLYEQVKNTLNRLQGNNVPNYQGLHAFWLSPKVFLTASLYGQRLIAPKMEDPSMGSGGGSCCGSNSTNPAISDPAEAAVDEHPTSKAEGNCWPSGGSGKGGDDPDETRSDKSAIIKGLRGEYPFDGSVYPPLLWDAAYQATEDDIQIIANWIDGGCLLDEAAEEVASDASVIKVKLRNKKMALAKGAIEHPVSENKTNTNQQANKGGTIRKEIMSLTKSELATYREALQCMSTYNDYLQDERSYDWWARIHTDSCQHGWEQFLPWHRLYLYFFEQKLQDFDSTIAIPYWDWAAYYNQNKTTFNNTQPDLGILPDSFGCSLSKEGYNCLSKVKTPSGNSVFTAAELSGLKKMIGKKPLSSGLRFLTEAGIEYMVTNDAGTVKWDHKVKEVYNQLKRENQLWFPNRWPGAIGGPTTYPNQQDINNILALNNFSDFGGGPSSDHHYGSLEKVHNGMHNFSGGTNPCYPSEDNATWLNIYKDLELTADPQADENPMYGWMVDNRITAFDPLFWSHHSNVDRLWAQWQEQHSGTPEGMNEAMAPWSLTVNDAMSIKSLGYTYLKDSVHYEVSSDVGMQTFRSAKTQVSSNTLKNHRKAEIRIHRVRRGNLPNARIRIFLNSPNANANTKTVGNDKFIEEIQTFHGSCYGGPGHCDLPLDRTRPFDKRSLHHHEPRDFKVDATATIKKLVSKGEDDITIQMVVVGINNKPINNALYLDGVSLNFLD